MPTANRSGSPTECCPSYYEIQATVNAPRAATGWKSNGYIIFDYYSATDFKFAGINITSGKLEIGHRTASGWVIDAQFSKSLKSGTDYGLGLVVDGMNSATGTSKVTLTVGNSVLTTRLQTASSTVKSYKLNTGKVGLGCNGSITGFDNVVVQKLARVVSEHPLDQRGSRRENRDPGTRDGPV